ncbi:MAG: DUF4350 domain-containing protein [Actinomycetota bacterium]|nr:DUF4350 domain-containing protein [Actinomycetota bacterium]
MNPPSWRPKKRSTRAILVGVAIVVGLNVILFWLNEAAGGPSGPMSSSYATSPAGVRAYADLLAEEGHEVERLRVPVDDIDVPGSATIVFLDPGAVTGEEARALRDFVERGGRLVVSVMDRAPWLETVTGEPVSWAPGGPSAVRPLVSVEEVAGVEGVQAGGTGHWTELGGAVPALGDGTDEGILLAIASAGEGRIALLADASPLQNHGLATGDNAALALALAGEPDRLVLFAESHHGYGEGIGLSALPTGWKVALAGLGLAAIGLVIARGRRLGPPERTSRDLAPPRIAYVESVAGILARTGHPQAAIAPVATAARAATIRRAGLRAEANDETVAAAARGLGVSEAGIAAISGRTHGDAQVLEAGRALAQLQQGGRR